MSEKGLGCALVVFILLALGLFAALICVLVIPPKPIAKFDEYTAEIEITENPRGIYIGSAARLSRQKVTVFSEHKWLTELFFNGKVISRIFSTGDDDMKTICSHIRDHDNCYVQSSNAVGTFIVPGNATLEQKKMDCSAMAQSIGRNVNECDVYSFFSYDKENDISATHRCFLESGTGYPLRCIHYQTDKYNYILDVAESYKTFVPGKPNNDDSFKPFDGVTVYDFRDGKGDAGDGKSNVFTKNAANILKKSLDGLMSWNRKKTVPDKTEEDLYLHSIRRAHLLTESLRVPPMGIPSNFALRSYNNNNADNTPIPSSFDARENWNNCTAIIGTITDQGSCGSCWAMASSGVLSDRLCLHGSLRHLSARYLVGCSLNNTGCWGGSVIQTWEDILKIGIPDESCLPFKAKDELCPEVCENLVPITNDRKVFPDGYVVPWGDTAEKRVEAIQREIMTNGPVEASFLVFSDFGEFWRTKAEFKGIYHRSADSVLEGGHSVRIIGWGNQPDHKYCEKYWIAANSWGTSRVTDGTFRICQGNNECNIEEQVVAGVFAW